MKPSDLSKIDKFTCCELCGAIHLHTTYSDGGVNYRELIEASRSLKLDYIIVTDHMNLGGLDNGFEGRYGNLSVIVGYEHNDRRNLNHYLAIGCKQVFSKIKKPRDYISAIKNGGGIGFLAHPNEKRHYFGHLPPYPWTDWKVSGYDGIEIWNQMSDWMENLKSWFSIFRLMYPRRFIGTVPPELLQRWDQLNKTHFVSGIGGVDAHTRRIGKKPFSLVVFPIKVELKGIRTHLYLDNPLSNDFCVAKKTIIDSLRDGRGFISNYRRGDAHGTKIFIEYSNGLVALPGKQSCETELPGVIHVSIPESGRISLIHNSIEVEVRYGNKATFPIIKQGVYRIEVHRESKAWIYSNPFPVGKYPIR